jgi:hypothetical protein
MSLVSPRRTTRIAVAAGLAAAALLASGSPALAAKGGKQSLVELQVSVTASGATATAVSYLNASATGISSTSCALDGVTVECGSAVDHKKTTTYTKTLTALTPGGHEYYQIVFFTDGSLTQGSSRFTVS